MSQMHKLCPSPASPPPSPRTFFSPKNEVTKLRNLVTAKLLELQKALILPSYNFKLTRFITPTSTINLNNFNGHSSTYLRHECRISVFSSRPGLFSGWPENTNSFHAGRLHVQNLDTSVECMRFQVVLAFFPAGPKHKSISCRSIAQNLDTSVECMFYKIVPAFFHAGRPARKYKSISCRSIVQTLDTSVKCMFLQFLFALCSPS